ncbi:pseudouridine synthase [Texcoconibacillus texcoconensis]|uniref:Pseudouridine synthase n=1 Tax=Texcoconibacillus texcoconensis TaxID=1095777 RepID=A0A840QNJ1_9BACI|nr:pseudouridine synthase [Texcoconibacillus texcoconensis]MBB5172952.1 23S rRNA pseudouridine2605 synthase [Texcoconibacillus texcoconensis]
MERLQKVIAQAGITSRRKAEKLIEEGKVTVNKETVKTLGVKVNPNQDDIEVEGIPLEKEAPEYYVLYKPTGVISAASDDRGRKVVTDYIGTDKRIYPIGRLDSDTSGLILLTNDGEFANQLMHPSYRIPKTYIAKVKGLPLNQELKQLERGVKLDGKKTAPAKVKRIKSNRKKGTTVIEITIHEGRNRQVRRMFDAIGYPVDKLKRERYGMITLKGLNAGEARELTPKEVKQLHDWAVT